MFLFARSRVSVWGGKLQTQLEKIPSNLKSNPGDRDSRQKETTLKMELQRIHISDGNFSVSVDEMRDQKKLRRQKQHYWRKHRMTPT
jgi:hypothetical protein